MTFQAMALGLVFVVIGFRALISPAQNDTFWHLRAGADIWRTGNVPTVDSYSYTAAGLPWPDHEWLWQAFSYGAYRLGGFPLLTVAVAGLILIAAVLVYRLTVGAAVTRGLALAVGLTLTSPVWALRPQIATMLAVVVLVTWLARERFWPIPLLFLIWANVHGGVVLGGLVLVSATAAAAVRCARTRAAADRRRAGALALVLPLAGLATCATPLGFHVFRFVWESTARLYVLRISEWRPTWPDNTAGVIFSLSAIGWVSLLARRWRALGAAPWPAWALVAATLALMGPAFRSLRNFAPFAVVAAPAATHLLGAEFRLRLPFRRTASGSPDHPRLNLALFAGLTAVALTLVAGAYAVRLPWLAWQPISRPTLAAVESCRAPIFNHYDDGGMLIWFAPDRPVFVDSRQDPYPLPFMLDAISVESGARPHQPLFAKWGVGCAFLKSSSKMVDRLRADGWQLRARDADWAVLAAPGVRMTFEAMAIAMLFIALAFRALLMPAQNDTFWNLRDGLEILRSGHVPHADTYSFTAAGAPYTDHEWLSQVLLAGAHRLAGMPGVELIAAAAVLGALALVYRLTIGPRMTRFIVLAPALSVASCVWVLRPQVFSLLAVALLVTLIVRERWRWLPPLFLIWANAHGGVVMGGLILAAAAVVALVRWKLRGAAEDARRLRALALFVPLSGLATLCTPLGVHLVPYILLTARRSRAIGISEWAATLPSDVLGVAFWLVAVAFVLIVVRRRRALPAAGWGDWALFGICGALFPVAVQSQRNMAPFLMFAAPAASRLLGPDFRFRLPRRHPRPPSADHPRLNLALVLGFGILTAAVAAVAWSAPIDRLEWRPIAPRALAALRACPGPTYNHYDDGGFLIWFTPERPVFVDSRQDPYPLELLLEHEAIERAQRGYRPLFDRYGIACAFLPKDSPTVKALGADGWTTRYLDDRYAVLSRR